MTNAKKHLQKFLLTIDVQVSTGSSLVVSMNKSRLIIIITIIIII